jgi:hypothetical protein
MPSAADTLLVKIQNAIVNPVIALLFAAALLVFLWGVFQFVRASDSDEGRRTGGRHILWGAVGMGIMLSVFGIINVILNTLDVPPDQRPSSTFLR